MASSTCWRCSTKASSLSQLLRLSSDPRISGFLPLHVAPFSTTSATSAAQLAKRGEKATFTKKRQNVSQVKARPPAPGERKALRKRIVLSNTNALEIPGMQELSVDSLAEEGVQGRVLAIPGSIVDRLRAVEAFKVAQNWSLFRKPSMLIRPDTLELNTELSNLSTLNPSQTVRKILVGERGSGKSVLLLQAMAMAFLKDWIVINIPNAMDLVLAHSDYAPIPSTSPTLYAQPTRTAQLLDSISRANPSLSTLSLSSTPPQTFPVPLQSNLSLSRLASIGSSDPDLAQPTFSLLLSELTRPSTPEHPRPPILLCIDHLAHAMRLSEYMSSAFAPIHAHDLFLLNWFTSYLSGTHSLPNSGMVLAATSESNQPAIPALRLRLTQLEQAQSPADFPTPAESLVPPFSLTKEQRAAQRDPFLAYDQRVLDVLDETKSGVQVKRVKGLSKVEARQLMEYWARSGLVRGVVSEELVQERWTISGGGIVGQLEKAVLGG